MIPRVDLRIFLTLLLCYLCNSILVFYLLNDLVFWKLWLQSFLIESLALIPIMIFQIFICKKLLLKDVAFIKSVFIYLLSCFIFYLFYLHVFQYFKFVFKGADELLVYNRIVSEHTTHFFLIYLINILIISIFYEKDRILAIELQKLQLKQELTKLRASILKYQLHPHFFFNTLNNISSLIQINPTLAQNTLSDFSHFLREILFLTESNTNSLDIELTLIKKYINIMSIKLGDDFYSEIVVGKDLEGALIPSLIIQPIIENSIQHGFKIKYKKLKLRIVFERNNDILVIKVINNGELIDEDNLFFGNGLKNTLNRLKTLYNSSFTFSIKNRKNNSGVETVMTFPLIFKNIDN